jgi:phosphotransferase system HPr (HPr) family protein
MKISKNLTILNKLGLHARAAAKLVALSNNFESEIILVKDNKSADARSIMKLLMLSASKGSVLEVNITGKDQKEAMDSIEELFLTGFDEGL